MALNIIKHDACFKIVDSLSPTIRKAFHDSQIAKSYASRRKKKQPVSLMKHYAHISSKIIKFNIC